MRRKIGPKKDTAAMREGLILGRVITRKASEARAGFFPLLQKVAAGRNPDVVLISHKDLPEGVALVNARRLRQSQALLDQLLSERGSHDHSFRLVGSATIVGEVEDVLEEVALRRKASATGKFSDL